MLIALYQFTNVSFNAVSSNMHQANTHPLPANKAFLIALALRFWNPLPKQLVCGPNIFEVFFLLSNAGTLCGSLPHSGQWNLHPNCTSVQPDSHKTLQPLIDEGVRVQSHVAHAVWASVGKMMNELDGLLLLETGRLGQSHTQPGTSQLQAR